MKRSIAIFAAVLLAGLSAMASASPHSPYAGQERRAVKTLSDSEMHDLMEGRGMGLAKAAELNGYPGPLHVLELAAEIGLSETQRKSTQALLTGMQQKARALGTRIVEAERELDRAFAENRIDPAGLRTRLQALAVLQAELRAVHLETHLDQRALLSADQVARYDALRGYRAAPASGGHRGHGH